MTEVPSHLQDQLDAAARETERVLFAAAQRSPTATFGEHASAGGFGPEVGPAIERWQRGSTTIFAMCRHLRAVQPAFALMAIPGELACLDHERCQRRLIAKARRVAGFGLRCDACGRFFAPDENTGHLTLGLGPIMLSALLCAECSP